MDATKNHTPVAVPRFELPVLQQPGVDHFHIHHERPFLWEERETTTVLVGGLSPTHDYLFEATLKALGVKARALPPTNLDAFHLGREYGNNGYCNPAYFTVGNLIRYLQELERSGVPKEHIVEHYVFFTIGCNAPCRFGMLETEYRMALKDCGFEGFRVLVFENEGGLNQKTKGNGMPVDPEFFLATVNALNLADVINDLVYATRPYEVVPGQTEEVRQKALDFLYEKLKNKRRVLIREPWLSFFKKLGLDNAATFLYRFLDQITSHYYTDALTEVHRMFDEVEVDRFKPRTNVKITGEFWAMTTVGAGNFSMFEFLESEGAVVLVEPVASLIQFLFSKGKLRHKNRRKVQITAGAPHWRQIRRRLRNFLQYEKKRLTLTVGNRLFRREYGRLLKALGGDYHMLIKQEILQKLAHRHYNINIEGGEGYMEIAKTIYYHRHGLCHMAISLKPFGCMPSTQSDAVQAAVMELDKEIIFLPIETAGEGRTNAQNRVLMSLGDARIRAKQEYLSARESAAAGLEEMRAYVDQHPELKSPFYVVPRRQGVASTAANFIYHLDELIQKDK